MPEDITQCSLSFNELSKPVEIKFDQAQASIDGGALLLKAADERLGLTGALAECVGEWRAEGQVVHVIRDLFRQRVYGYTLGHADGNDATVLRHDPVHQLLAKDECGEAATLASQPSISRFENSVSRTALMRMSKELAKLVCKRHRKRLGKRVRKITIDIDPTEDATYGRQQLTFFNGFYDTYCYLPYVVTVQFNDERRQYVLGSVLRAGNLGAPYGAVSVLKRVLACLRECFGETPQIYVRLDGGFAAPDVLEYLNESGVQYVIGFAPNPRLKDEILLPLVEAGQRARDEQRTVALYGDTSYEARSWDDERRVVWKAEALYNSDEDIRANPRFVVTNMKRSPKVVYKFYVARGDAENRIKELKKGVQMDRTSCSDFRANSLRVILAVAACILYQELQLHARFSDAANWQVWTLRERLFKLGAWVKVSCRRIVFHLPSHCPWIKDWMRIATSLGAVPG